MLSTVNGVLLMEFKVPITKIERLSSYPSLACAISCIFASVFARMYGKRPVYIVSTSIFLISCVWTATIKTNYNSFFAARFVSGLGLGAYEAIVLSSVGDMYFVRGSRWFLVPRSMTDFYTSGPSKRQTYRLLQRAGSWTCQFLPSSERLCRG